MVKKVGILLVFVLVIIAGGGAYFFLPDILASSEKYAEKKEASLASTGVTSLVIETDVDEITLARAVSGKIGALAEVEINLPEKEGKEALSKNFKYEIVKRGSRVSVLAVYNQNILNHFRGIREYVYLTVYVPSGLDVQIKNNRGTLFIGNLTNTLSLLNKGESCTVDGVVGKVEVIDGSGDLVFGSMKGDLTIRDGKGKIEVEGCEGGLSIIDTKGAVSVKGIKGSVDISDTSGTINLDTIKGEVTVKGGRRSFITAKKITGDVEITY